MKRLFPILLLLVALFSFSPSPAGAVNVIPVCNRGGAAGTDASSTSVCKDVNAELKKNPHTGALNNPIIRILKAAIKVVSYITGAAAVILVIVSGIQFIVANGDSASVAHARGTLIYALIGIAIAALAQAIVAFVLNKL